MAAVINSHTFEGVRIRLIIGAALLASQLFLYLRALMCYCVLLLDGITSCRELDLSNNTISEIGEGLARMASLQVLRLENNRIDALPDNIGSCKALVKLDLSTNNLLSLPDSMGQFRKLQRLNVANNMLRRVPASMGGLKTLKELDLRYVCLPRHHCAHIVVILLGRSNDQ